MFKLIYKSLIMFMLAVSGLLVFEYSFFKEQAQRLVQLRTEYTEHMLALKKIMLDYEVALKKKNNLAKSKDLAESGFLVVKRDSTYLKESALDYAKQHNIDIDLQKIYESEEPFSLESVVSKSKNVDKEASEKLVEIDIIDKLSKKCRRQAIFDWPIEKSRFWLSSLFGPRKKTDGSWGFHKGIDMAAVKGTIVRAAESGKVIDAGYRQGYGKMVLIEHNYKYKTKYAHFDEILVKVGSYVKKNDIIGRVGSTGNVRKAKKNGDASHLHFEVYLHDKHVNPFYYLK